MQDDSPWKPPSTAPGVPESGDAAAPQPPAESPSVWAPAAGEPSLPTTPPAATPSASPTEPSLPSASPAEPPAPPVPNASAEPTLPAAPSLPAAAPAAPASPFAPASSPFAPSTDDAAPAPAVTVATGRPAGRSARSRWLVGGAVTAVVAVGAAGVFAVSSLTEGAQGGAESPSELGLSLLQAIEDEDVLGVVDVLAPGERDVFRDPLVDLVSELTRLDILSDDADLSRILGIDIEFTNEAVSAVSTNVPDIVNIDMRADVVATLDGAELPIGSLITDNLPDDLVTELRGTRLTDTDDFDARLTAIEQDGRWYFSVFHSIAEAARGDVAPGTLIPLEGIGATGSDSPSAAFDLLLDQVEALDVAGLIRTLNPGEAAALQRYSPLFLDGIQPAIDAAPFEWTITNREFHVDESGDHATVFLDAFGVEGSVEGESFSADFTGDCARIEVLDQTIEQCSSDTVDEATAWLDEAPAVKRLIDTVTEAFSDMEEVGLELRLTDGEWYVSPTTTGTEAFLKFLRALDRSELDAMIEQAPAAADEAVDLLLGAFLGIGDFGSFDFDDGFGSDFGDDFGDEVFAVDEPATQATTEVDDPDTTLDESADVIEEPSDGSVESCYGESEPDAALECFAAAVDRGDLDIEVVPIELRFPECGYTASWGGGKFQLPDDEFIAAAEAARPCFLDLLDQGLVSEWELPTEIAHLECFEGRNWYTVYDDPDYDTRYLECLDGAPEG